MRFLQISSIENLNSVSNTYVIITLEVYSQTFDSIKQPREVFCKKRCSQKLGKIHRKTLCQSLFLIKLQALNFAKFLRASFLQNTSGQLLPIIIAILRILETLQKICQQQSLIVVNSQNAKSIALLKLCFTNYIFLTRYSTFSELLFLGLIFRVFIFHFVYCISTISVPYMFFFSYFLLATTIMLQRYELVFFFQSILQKYRQPLSLHKYVQICSFNFLEVFLKK